QPCPHQSSPPRNLPDSGKNHRVFAPIRHRSQGIRRDRSEGIFKMRIAPILLSMLAATPIAISAQPPAAPAPATAPAAHLDPRAVVAEVRRVIAERYVLPERRPALDAILARGLASGRFDVAE